MESDIIAIHRNNNTVDNLELHGRFGNGSCTQGLNIPAGVMVEIGHASDPYSPYATLTVAFTTKLACGRSVTFVEPLPAEMNVTDFMSPQMAPRLLHIKNVRAGNHEYNIFNVKAHAMIFEQSFFYNETMAAVDISTDGYYWYEGPRANNIQVKDCCFQRCASAISIVSQSWMGPGATQGHIAPHATHNVSLTRNWIYHNGSIHSGSPQYPGVLLDLGAVSNITFEGNEIFLESGMRRDVPLISLCNVEDAMIRNNSIKVVSRSGPYGDDCLPPALAAEEPHAAQRCEPFPLGRSFIHRQGSFGCNPSAGTNVTVDPTQLWYAAIQPNTLSLRFGPDDYTPDFGKINPATSLPFLNRANAVHTPGFQSALVDRNGLSISNVVIFNRSLVTPNGTGAHINPGSHASPGSSSGFNGTFIDLSSSWNGLTNAALGAGLQLGESFSMSVVVLCDDVQMQQVIIDWGGERNACGYPYENVHCSGEFVLSVESGQFQVLYQHPSIPHNQNDTRLVASATPNVWHTINLTVASGAAGTTPGAPDGSGLADWTLRLDGAIVATSPAQPEWHIAMSRFSRLGAGVQYPHDVGGAPFGGAMAAFDVVPL